MVRMVDRMPDELRRPERDERSSVFHGLRFMASCALGGALLTGVVLGHDVSGFDPRSIGAALGLVAGLVAVVARAV